MPILFKFCAVFRPLDANVGFRLHSISNSSKKSANIYAADYRPTGPSSPLRQASRSAGWSIRRLDLSTALSDRIRRERNHPHPFSSWGRSALRFGGVNGHHEPFQSFADSAAANDCRAFRLFLQLLGWREAGSNVIQGPELENLSSQIPGSDPRFLRALRCQNHPDCPIFAHYSYLCALRWRHGANEFL